MQITHSILTAVGLHVVALFMVRIELPSRLLVAHASVFVILLILLARLAERWFKRPSGAAV